MPQINCVETVTSRDSDVTELNAVKSFQEMDPKRHPDLFMLRCWIHTHPRFDAFMSSTDILQMYSNACLNRHSFGIVLSPKREGVKALCVWLTEIGFVRIREWFIEARTRNDPDERSYVVSKLSSSTIEFYCQIPFRTSAEQCLVADLRSKEEVINQLKDFIDSGTADTCWIRSPTTRRNIKR